MDAAADVGLYTSLAIDSAGNLHVSYWDAYWEDLKYAKLTGSTWTIMPVDTVGYIGYLGTSIEVDSANNPHISYYDNDNGDLKYAFWNGLNWNILTVDSAGAVGLYSSLALDSNNRAHISYYDFTNFDLKYAYWTGSSWSIQTVDSTGAAGFASSLELDTNNRPHITYWQSENSFVRLKYARWTGSAWNFETVDQGIGYAATSLKLDSSNNPHISYFKTSNLMYAKKTGSTWTTETVDASQAVGSRSSLSLDSNGSPHIAYVDDYWLDLKYAKLTDHGWFIKNVDNVGNVGDYPSLVLDSSNHPHIVYRDETNKNLKYARNPDETFKSESYQAFDGDGDLKFDSVKLTLDIDTTYSGTLSIFVFAALIDLNGQVRATNSTNLSITSDQSDPFNLILNLLQTAPEGNYDIYSSVEDDSGTTEASSLLVDVVYLYPPQTSQIGFLTGTVTDQDSGESISGIEVQIDGLPAFTNSTGQYYISLEAGSYNVSVYEDLYQSVTITDVTVVAGVTTTQDIVLESDAYVLELQVQGSGSLNPAAGFYHYPIGSEVEVQATADSGWTFAYWLFDLVDVGSENPYSFFMDSDHALKAVFIEESQVGIFHGTVLDAESESPIAEAKVNIDFSIFLTDPAGNFELELTAGEYNVLVEANGYFSQERQILVEAGGATEEIFLLQSIESAETVIESSNSGAEQKDVFELGETVYVAGNGYSPSTTYNLYVVEDVATWTDGVTIPPRVLGTAITISSNSEGGIPPTVAWSNPQIVGKYDIVVDVNDNGVYDSGLDALDDSDVEVTAGAQIIPEFPTGIVLTIFVSITLFALIIKKKLFRPQSRKSLKQYSRKSRKSSFPSLLFRLHACRPEFQRRYSRF